MKLFNGFIIIFILAVIFSYFQGFIDFLINLGLMPEGYKNNQTFDVMMIFIVYVILMATAFFVGFLIIFSARLFNWRLNQRITKAKNQAEKEYGTTLPYFYFLDQNIKSPLINGDKSSYTFEVCELYLYEKTGNWTEVDRILRNKNSTEERLKLYEEARLHFKLPNIMDEYGIF